MQIYICTVDICKKEFYNFYELVKHLKFHIKKKEQIVCPYSQCKNKYTVVSSFTGHMSKMHRKCSYNTGNVQESHDNDDAMESTSEFFEPLNEASTESIILSNNCRELRSEINDQINASSIEELEDVGNEVYNTAIESNLFTENVAQFYLKLECQYLLSATTIQYIITEVSKLHEETQKIIKNKLTEWLATEGISQQQIASIKDVFNSDTMIKTNEILTTNFKRKKFYKNKFDYVSPVQVIIDQQKKTSFAYVPIIETLKRFFTDKSVRNELGYQKKPGKKDVLEDFMDGNVYKNNKFFQENPDALRIILYQDAFEIINPIGAAKRKHKLLAIYMCLGNVPYYLRCHINSIKLVVLCKELDFEHETVYGKVVTDFKKMKHGVEINGKFIKGSLVFVVGDNLGSHGLGGFTENFSTSQYLCRFCLATKDEFNREDGAYKHILPGLSSHTMMP